VERTHQSACAPTTTSRPTPSPEKHGPESGVLECVAIVLLDQRLCVAWGKRGDDLPAVASVGEFVVGVLDPDHRYPLASRPLERFVEAVMRSAGSPNVPRDVVLITPR
jgi:hypothetical protein